MADTAFTAFTTFSTFRPAVSPVPGVDGESVQPTVLGIRRPKAGKGGEAGGLLQER